MVLQYTKLFSITFPKFRFPNVSGRPSDYGKVSGSIRWTKTKGRISNQSQRELVVQSANQN